MKYSVLIGLICVVLVGELARADRLSSHDWQLFKRQHGKSYESPAEEARRFANFMATKQRVERHNAQGNSSFRMGLNHLADWTQEERAKLRRVKSRLIRTQQKLNETSAYLAEILGSSSGPVPEEFDWRTVPGRVTGVKDQGGCASGWAFATVAALEGQEIVRVFSNASQVVQLSEQELLDCSVSNNGCDGGGVFQSLEDLTDVGGIVSSKHYPYTAVQGKCSLSKQKVVMTDAGSTALPELDEVALKRLLPTVGPVAVSVEASEAFDTYQSGVLIDKTCSDELTYSNHFVLLVGYGTDPKHGDYWLAKNSFGSDWGENGYIRIQRGQNMCGIAFEPIVPKF